MYSRMILVRRIGTRIELLMIRSRESVQMMPFESFERKYIIDKFVSIPKQNEFPNDSVNPKIKLIRKHFENLHSGHSIFAISRILYSHFINRSRLDAKIHFSFSLGNLRIDIANTTGLDSNHCLLEGCSNETRPRGAYKAGQLYIVFKTKHTVVTFNVGARFCGAVAGSSSR